MIRTGGRTATITLDSVVDAGVRIGLAELSVQRVADSLGVTTAAVYRHIPSRAALEGLVGEAILADLTLSDDPADSAEQHLVSFGSQLRQFVLGHPGCAAYLQRLFPRGPSGIRLMETQINVLGQRGYDPAGAVVLCSAVATITLGIAAAEEARLAHASGDPDGAEEATRDALSAMAGSPLIQAATAGLPPHTAEDYFLLLLRSAANGLVAQLPPGRSAFTLITPREDD